MPSASGWLLLCLFCCLLHDLLYISLARYWTWARPEQEANLANILALHVGTMESCLCRQASLFRGFGLNATGFESSCSRFVAVATPGNHRKGNQLTNRTATVTMHLFGHGVTWCESVVAWRVNHLPRLTLVDTVQFQCCGHWSSQELSQPPVLQPSDGTKHFLFQVFSVHSMHAHQSHNNTFWQKQVGHICGHILSIIRF